MSHRSRLFAALLLLTLVAQACSLPGLGPAAETPETISLSPTPSPPLPPVLVERDPAPGEELHPKGAITLYFDQAMDAASVEAAFGMEPSVQGSFSWPDPSTLVFRPAAPLPRESSYQVSIGTGARSAAGLRLATPVQFSLRTAGFLRVAQVLPTPDAQEVDPASPLTVIFNRPVVPLGVDQDLPQPLRIYPSVPGHGRWIDTAVYLFEPEQPLDGGVTYTVRLEAGLEDLLGGALEEPFSWTFTTSWPRLIAHDPAPGTQNVARDASITLTFNQAMDQESVERAFQVESLDGRVIAGSFSWDEEGKRVTFAPQDLLDYGVLYRWSLSQTARSRGGTALGAELAASFTTVPRPLVVKTTPSQGGLREPYRGVEITFNVPMDKATLLQALKVTPAVEGLGVFWDGTRNVATVHGAFQPATRYTLTLTEVATDPYGTPIREPLILSFTTLDERPSLGFTRYSPVIALTPDGAQSVELQAENLSRIDLSLYRLSLDQALLAMQRYSFTYDPRPTGELLRVWSIPGPQTRNRRERMDVELYTQSLDSGFYLLIADSPDDDRGPQGRMLLVRGVELVLKSTEDSALVWAVDLSDGQPYADLAVRFLDEDGRELAAGRADAEGLVELAFAAGTDPYTPYFAVSGSPGSPGFGFTSTAWDDGIQPYQFGVGWRPEQPEITAYLYTDRPLYRPGHQVRFRGVLRRVQDERYSLPDMDSLKVTIRDPEDEVVFEKQLPLSTFGTFDGSFTLASEAPLGTYRVETEYGSVYFGVSAYRKPEFTVSVTPSVDEVVVGEPLQVTVEAEYFFGGPVADAEVEYRAWLEPFFPPGLPRPMEWSVVGGAQYLSAFYDSAALMEGQGRTGPEGRLVVEIPTDELETPTSARIIFSATLTESSGFPVSAQTAVDLHPAELYLALLPERYNVRVGETAVVRLEASDWGGEPLGGVPVSLRVERQTWEQVVDDAGNLTWRSRGTPVNEGARVTAADGSLLFSFQPQQAGTYRLEASASDAAGREARSQVTLWVAGEDAGLWRQPAGQRIVLVPDRFEYQPGQSAQVLVPSPFSEPVMALVTVERRGVIDQRVVQIAPGGSLVEVPIESFYAPNVYLSVVLVQGGGQGRAAAVAVGLVELKVAAGEFQIQVSLQPDREQAGPGEQVTYILQASDARGRPVQAEFSLALADLAALSLAQPNSPSPFKAFYGRQLLGVHTAASLSVSGEAEAEQVAGGIGGGGEADLAEVRQDFPDTAYWNASIVTDENGRAEITLTLPDSLTTWRMEARGVTMDTKVGSATVDLIATKPLLIRPVTPRFFTAGDRATVAAVVHNNTQQELSVEVRLVAAGAQVQGVAATTLSVPAGGRVRQEWALQVQDVPAVDLTFQVAGGGLRDASKPTVGTAREGALPVLRYSAPDTAATAGALTSPGERLEVVSLPRSFDATRGELRVLLEPSLGAVTGEALEALQAGQYASTEQVVSRLLAHLAYFRGQQAIGLGDASMQQDLEAVIDESLQVLRARQRADGGWGWWRLGASNTYMTAYALFGLARARQAGALVGERTLERAITYLQAGVATVGMLPDDAARDLQAFVLYALEEAGAGNLPAARALAAERERLSLQARALLTLTLAGLDVTDAQISILRGDLESAAVRTSTGVAWQERERQASLPGTSTALTAHALRALLETAPDSQLIPAAVRWLVAARRPDGAWSSGHETAWAMLALADWLSVSGDGAGSYEFGALLNGESLASGQATPGSSPVSATVPVGALFSDRSNALVIQHGPGDGTLYYTAHLTVYRPVEQAGATARGLAVSRQVFLIGACGQATEACSAVDSAAVGQELLVRVTLVVPSDQYYVMVEDPFPAGAEPIDTSLRTSAQGGPSVEASIADVLQGAWGWWWFDHAELGDDRLRLFAQYLPAGTYQYVYRMRAVLPGEYRVLPPRAWVLYFPEVFGQGEGRVFTIEAAEQAASP